MTRCNKDCSNLKSSVYNQTGQSYFEQISLYNSMSSHLRRVLLAKSVVDAKNPRYTRRKRNKCEGACNRSRSLEESRTEDVIDRLAYDTEHLPLDILRMSWNHKHPCLTERTRSARQCSIAYEDYYSDYDSEPRIQTDRAPLGDIKTGLYEKKEVKNGKSRKFNRKSSCCWSERSPKRLEEPHLQQAKEIKFKGIKSEKSREKSHYSPFRRDKCQDNHDEHLSNVSISSFESLTEVSGPESRSAINKILTEKELGSSLHTCLASKHNKNMLNEIEEAKYAKFVYDITQEIMQNGLYIDKDIQTVFRKHIERNSGILEKGKMLYEIYQLKISLNMMDSEADDEEMDYIYSHKFSNLQEAKPPTPPRVLDDNKVVDKLISYQKLDNQNKLDTSDGSRSVILVDANPELLVTERDVLVTLIENKMEPKQAEHICKSLFNKSRDISMCQMMQAEAANFDPRYLEKFEQSNDVMAVNGYEELQQLNLSSKKESIKKKTHRKKNLNSTFSIERNSEKYSTSSPIKEHLEMKKERCACVSSTCKKHTPRYFQERDFLRKETSSERKPSVLRKYPEVLKNNNMRKGASDKYLKSPYQTFTADKILKPTDHTFKEIAVPNKSQQITDCQSKPFNQTASSSPETSSIQKNIIIPNSEEQIEDDIDKTNISQGTPTNRSEIKYLENSESEGTAEEVEEVDEVVEDVSEEDISEKNPAEDVEVIEENNVADKDKTVDNSTSKEVSTKETKSNNKDKTISMDTEYESDEFDTDESTN